MLFRPMVIKCSNGDCPNTFMQKELKNRYCSRKCSSAAWNRKNRLNKKDKVFPMYRCRECGEFFRLTFDPTLARDGGNLSSAICPDCVVKIPLSINVSDSIKTNEKTSPHNKKNVKVS